MNVSICVSGVCICAQLEERWSQWPPLRPVLSPASLADSQERPKSESLFSNFIFTFVLF